MDILIDWMKRNEDRHVDVSVIDGCVYVTALIGDSQRYVYHGESFDLVVRSLEERLERDRKKGKA